MISSFSVSTTAGKRSLSLSKFLEVLLLLLLLKFPRNFLLFLSASFSLLVKIKRNEQLAGVGLDYFLNEAFKT